MNRLCLFICNSAAVLAVITSTPLCAHADSLWHDDSSRAMFADNKAGKVGDILTIVVQESSTASKDANTKTSKKSSADIALKTFLYSPDASGMLTHKGQMPALEWDAGNDFDGSGQVGSTEKITSRIAVRVVDVLPNGNLMIEGTRHTAFSGETQDVVLRGLVRPPDIAANNTVFSYNVADVSIQIVSKGIATSA